MNFAIETVLSSSEPAVALRLGARHVPIAALAAKLGLELRLGRLSELLEHWDAAWPLLDIMGRASSDFPELALLDAPVVPQFGAARTIVCAGPNSRRRLLELNASVAKDDERGPFLFLKPHGALVGPGKTIPLDPEVQQLDGEVELVAVVGRRVREVPVREALAHVAGYTVAIDVTARDRLMDPNSLFRFDFLAGKGQDGYCPTSTALLPAAFLPDPQAAQLTLSVNGVVKQRTGTDDLLYSVAELISWASRRMTLEPGDLILTGAPSGAGFAGGELKAGDVVRAELAGLAPAEFTVFATEGPRA